MESQASVGCCNCSGAEMRDLAQSVGVPLKVKIPVGSFLWESFGVHVDFMCTGEGLKLAGVVANWESSRTVQERRMKRG